MGGLMRSSRVEHDGPFPFAVGPLYVLSAGLARRTFNESHAVAAMAAAQAFDCRAEDVTVGFAIHLAGQTLGFDVTLGHMTWTKLHNYDPHGNVDFQAS